VASLDVASANVASVAGSEEFDRPTTLSRLFAERFPVAHIMEPLPRERTSVDSTLGLLERFCKMPAIAWGTEESCISNAVRIDVLQVR